MIQVVQDYIKVNNEVTLRSLKERANPSEMEAFMVRYRAVLDIVKPYINTDMKILDLGCKDGAFMDLLVAEGYDILGVDCSDDALGLCLKKGLDVVKQDVQDLHIFENESYDMIFLIHTLEHVPQPKLVVSECNRLLPSGGLLFVEVPIQAWEPAEDWGHFHPFTSEQELTKLFDKDFELITMDSQKPASRKPWYRFLYKRI